MFLLKRKSIYYLQYFDEAENRIKRVSTKQISKKLALKFLSEFKSNQALIKKVTYKTLKEFIEEYQSTFSNTFSKNHLRGVKSTFDVLCRELSPDIPMTKISPLILEKFLTQTFHRTQSSAWLYYRILKSAFNKAVVWNYITENPLSKIKLPKQIKRNPAFISELELAKILENEPDETLRHLYILGFFTGMRRDEMINLQWKAIDFKNEIVIVQNSNTFTTKSRKDRIIPMASKVKEILTTRYPKLININGNDFVFCKPTGFKYESEFVSKRFRKAVNKSKLSKDVHLHSLRHSFASNLVSKGVSIYEVSNLLGHGNVSTTQIYSHLRSEDLRNAVNLLNH